MTPIPGDLLSHLEETGVQAYIPLEASSQTGSSSKASPGWTALSSALRDIAQALERHDDKAALRLTIHDLGSVDWASPSAPVSLTQGRVADGAGDSTLHPCPPWLDHWQTGCRANHSPLGTMPIPAPRCR